MHLEEDVVTNLNFFHQGAQSISNHAYQVVLHK